MRHNSFLLALLLACSAIISGCATTQPAMVIVSSVDSLALPDAAAKKRYILLPGSKGIEAGNLQFIEFAGYVENVLAERGFVKVEPFEDEDIIIFLTYAIGDPQTFQYTYSIPTWGQTGVSSSRTYGTVYPYSGGATYSGTTTYTPTYGITGSTTHIGSATSYTKFLFLDAYDVPTYVKEERMVQVWTTSVTNTGVSGDLRYIFPYMVVAMKPHLGTNTGRKVEVEVPVNDPAVQILRGGQSQ